MAANKKSPEIRFDGFKKDWVENYLGIEVDFYSGLTYSPSDIQKGIGTFVIRSSNVKEGELVKADDVFVNPEIVNSLNVEKGDIVVVVRNGSRSLIGKHAQIKDNLKDTVIGAFMTGLRPKNNTDFINALLDTQTFQKEIQKNLGATINQITTGPFKKMEFFFPDSKEQMVVGSFFKNLNTSISISKIKITKLKNLKRSMLVKMFPQEGASVPEIRFRGFSQKWENLYWNENVDISNNMVDPRDEQYKELYHIGPGNIESFTGRIVDNVQKVKNSNLISGKFLFRKGDLIYGKINPQLAKYTIAPYSGLASADSYVLNAHTNLFQLFLYVILQTNSFYKYSVSVSARTGMPKINREELSGYNFLAPQIEEQKMIGKYFLNLDTLIASHHSQIEKLNNIKSALLNKLFVN